MEVAVDVDVAMGCELGVWGRWTRTRTRKLKSRRGTGGGLENAEALAQASRVLPPGSVIASGPGILTLLYNHIYK